MSPPATAARRAAPAPRYDRITTVPESSFSPEIRAARAALRANSAQRRQNVELLRQHIGRPDFYEVMARVDPRSAGEWRRMVGMQAQFQRGESGYDRTTRTYSESMRESLHRAAIELYRRQPPGDVFGHFISIHPALFNANGAFSGAGTVRTVTSALGVTNPAMRALSRAGSGVDGFAVVTNTNLTEVFRNFTGLLVGANNNRTYAPIANQVAEETRIARERRGLPITPR
ncbi:MAG: hypothetical protein JNK82_04330 [Myxococcaceae bacterium]|nr:hypothetical protein [Myxococcaceae bacterium]